MNATQRLARFAIELNYRDIPNDVIERAKACILDTLAVSLYGSTKPWSRIVSGFIRDSGLRGHSTVLGEKFYASAGASDPGQRRHGTRLRARQRAPAGRGRASRRDGFSPCLRDGGGKKADGKSLLTAFVAACEVMSRIGVAAGNSLESRGFHAPGLTGTFGGAVAAGRLMKLNQAKMVNALGIAGSYSGGLIEFSRCQEGAMIKRLHLGKAAEGGVTAAMLASRGFAGPESILEGKFGFCQTFSDSPKLDYLTHRLGREFESMNIGIKRCACHINAHAPIEALEKLRGEFGFNPEDIREITVGGIEKLVTPSRHLSTQRFDDGAVQHSVLRRAEPLFRSHRSRVLRRRKLKDKKILAMMRKVRLKVDHEIEQKGWDRAARVTVALANKQRHSELIVHFKGTPRNPMSQSEVEDKARKLTRAIFSEQQLERLVEAVKASGENRRRIVNRRFVAQGMMKIAAH